MRARVTVTLKREVLDPQGEAIRRGFDALGLQGVREVRVGKVIEVELDHDDDHGWEYEVKVLTANGPVREVKLGAPSGMVRKIEDD